MEKPLRVVVKFGTSQSAIYCHVVKDIQINSNKLELAWPIADVAIYAFPVVTMQFLAQCLLIAYVPDPQQRSSPSEPPHNWRPEMSLP